MLRFSIVIINHNYGRFLGEAIDSALAQRHPEFEVVVVDDGSTDDSDMVLSRYAERIILLRQTQRGHVEAVNAGLAAATGDAVLFLDADDKLYPDCLARVAQRWETGLSKLQFRLDTIDRDGCDQHAPFPYFPNDLTPEEVLRQSFTFGVYPWTVSSGNVFARSYLNAVMPIDSAVIYRSPDGYLSKMAPLYGRVETVTAVLGAYRVHGSNAWAIASGDLRQVNANRWVRFDRVLCDAFAARAKALGHSCPPYEELASLQRAEQRLIGFRADRSNYPYPEDSASILLKNGLHAAIVAPNVSGPGRLIWMGWFLALAFAPFGAINLLYRLSRTQSKRASVARMLIAWARGRARSKRRKGTAI